MDLSEAFAPPEVALGRRVCNALGLRPYQRESVESVIIGWEEKDVTAQLLCLATGCGKTPLIAALARIEIERDGRVLVLAHTDELIDQALQKIERFGKIKGAKEKASNYAGRYAKCVVGSVQTMSGEIRLKMWPSNHFTLILVDECHRSLSPSYQKILNKFRAGGARIVGVTATADRGDKRSLGEFYQRIAFDYSILHAVRDGWLIRPIVKTLPLQLDVSGVGVKKTAAGTDFDQGAIAEKLKPLLGAIATQVVAASPGKIRMFFMPSVETAQMMSDSLNAVGSSSEWISGDREERRQIVADFKRGKYENLANMAVLTEGFDYDKVSVIVCLRPTKIRALFVQIVGRACRPLDEIVAGLNSADNAAIRHRIIRESSKPHYTILDFLWLHEKHEMVKPASLVTERDEVKKRMAADGDLMEMEERAERDVLADLEKKIRENQHKESQTLDPLAIASELCDVELADYAPETQLDAAEPTPMQLGKLRANGIDSTKIKYRGHATKLIMRIVQRQAEGLSTIRQMNFFKTLGIDVSLMKREDAQRMMDERTRGIPVEDVGL